MKARFLAIAAMVAAFPIGACSSSSPSPGADAGGASDGAIADSGAPIDGGQNAPDSSTSDSGSKGDGSPTAAQVGDPCTSDNDCPGDGQKPGKCETTWPGGGACTILGCGVGQCPGSDTWCQPYGMQTYCAPLCQPGVTGCPRSGYTCVGGGCLPASFAGDGG